MKTTVFIISILFNLSFAQKHDIMIRGSVKDAQGNSLPFATVRIDHTTLGTVCDNKGMYELVLPSNTVAVTYSYIGYQSRSIQASGVPNEVTNIVLVQSEIALPEVIVDSEDPAYAIIREAMKYKRKRQKAINEYSATVYIKESFGTDSMLAMISEAHCRLHIQKYDSLEETVLWRRQSSNIPAEFQFALTRDHLNFYDDTIRYMGHSFVGPLADNAFDHYEYRLVRSTIAHHQTFFSIEFVPLSELRPLFRGMVTISDSEHTLQKIHVSPNTMFQIPLITIDSLEISQQFSLYEKQYWLPLEYHISADVRYRFFSVLTTKPFRYHKSVISYEYMINSRRQEILPVRSALLSLPQAQTILEDNGGYPVVFPLTSLEKASYKRIDEIVQQRPFFSQLPKYVKQLEEWTRNTEIRYNRSEGLFLGGKGRKTIFSGFRSSLKLGYGISDQIVKYVITPEIMMDSEERIVIGLDYYRWIRTFPLNYRIHPFTNSFAALMDGDDYFNYYLVHGYRLFISYALPDNVVLEASIINDNQTSAYKNTDISLNSLTEPFRFRSNPSISEGRYVSAVLEFSRRQTPDTSGFTEPQNTWNVRIEQIFSSRNRNVTSMYADVTFRIPTMGDSRLLDPYLGIMLAAGRTIGESPVQKLFAIESPLSGYAYPSSFRTVMPAEFMGDRFTAASIEHNFRSIPFVLLGLTALPMDIIVRAAVCDIKTISPPLGSQPRTPLVNYTEYTVGLGRLADIFRIDFSYARYHQSRYAVTFTSYL